VEVHVRPPIGSLIRCDDIRRARATTML
jgi:hypothetical protein